MGSHWLPMLLWHKGSWTLLVRLYCCGQLWVWHMFCGQDLWWAIPLHIYHWSCWDTIWIPTDRMDLCQTHCKQVLRNRPDPPWNWSLVCHHPFTPGWLPHRLLMWFLLEWSVTAFKSFLSHIDFKAVPIISSPCSTTQLLPTHHQLYQQSISSTHVWSKKKPNYVLFTIN